MGHVGQCMTFPLSRCIYFNLFYSYFVVCYHFDDELKVYHSAARAQDI